MPPPDADPAGVDWRGREEHPLDRDLAELNRDVYAEMGSVISGWSPLAVNSGHIRRYTVENDVLTELQEQAIQTRALLPDAIGHRIRLRHPDPLSLLEHMVPGRSLFHGIEAHSMETVLRALDLPERSEHLSHPVVLLQQSLEGLRSLRQARAYSALPLEPLANTATFLAARAHECGLSRIDHVVASDDGSRLFAIQGSRADPAQRRVTIDAASAVCTPAARSATALRAIPAESQEAQLVPRIDWQQAHHVLGH